MAVSDLSDCSPLDTTVSSTGVTLPIYPCGLIANSLFNGLFGIACRRSWALDLTCCGCATVSCAGGLQTRSPT